MARCLSARSRCFWLSLLFCSLICFFLLFQLYSFCKIIGVQYKELDGILAKHPFQLRDLEQVEGLTLLPPYGLRNHEKTNFNDEFLNASSTTRSLFFPTYEVIDPRKEEQKNDRYYFEGRIWLDTDGNPIQAHGGGILFDEKSSTYYWYGEYKNGPTYLANGTRKARVDVIGVGCYSSDDLWAWKYEGIVLAAEEDDTNHDLHKRKVLERPKVIYNEKSNKYVMWMHVDDATYTKASVGVAISDSPAGSFEYLYSKKPNGFKSRDMTVFKDENGMAYLIYSSIDEIHISPLSNDYLYVLDTTVRALKGQHRETPVVFKFKDVYYMITSGRSGWSPNEAVVHEAESIFGPWESIGNPCVGANKVFRVASFFAESTFVLPMPGGADADGWFISMADRWNKDDLKDSRYVWLPLNVEGRIYARYHGLPLWSRVSIFWHKQWRLPVRKNGRVEYVTDVDL